jgi:hypothetical protein
MKPQPRNERARASAIDQLNSERIAMSALTRRNLLATAAVAAPIAAVPVAALASENPAHPDAELLRLVAEHRRVITTWEAGVPDAEADVLAAAEQRLIDRMLALPVHTLEGITALGTVAWEWLKPDFEDYEETMQTRLVCGFFGRLARLAGPRA